MLAVLVEQLESTVVHQQSAAVEGKPRYVPTSHLGQRTQIQ